jgi:hypothetical protein
MAIWSERTSGLCHKFWNLKQYSFGVEGNLRNQQGSARNSYTHKRCSTASRVSALALGATVAQTFVTPGPRAPRTYPLAEKMDIKHI